MSKKKIRRSRPSSKPKVTRKSHSFNPKVLRIAAIAVAALVLLGIIWYFAIYDDGSLVIRNGAVVGRQDSWLIANLDKGKNSSYYKVADVAAPAGYADAEESAFGTAITTSDNVSYLTTFSFDAEEEANPIDSIAICPLAKTPAEAVESARGNYEQLTASELNGEAAGAVSEIASLDTAEGEGFYFTYQYAYLSEDTGNIKYSQALVMYIPTARKNSCILISLNAYPADADNYLSSDALMAQAQQMVDSITICK